MFPEDVIGGANTLDAAPRKVRIQWGSDQVETDVVRGKYIFRRRGWVRRFFRETKAAAGHQVILEQQTPYLYRLSLEPWTQIWCLSIQQPWAKLILEGKKWIENRPRPWRDAQDLIETGNKVVLGIHVSCSLSIWNKLSPTKREYYAPGWNEGEDSPRGAVVGIVELVRIWQRKDLPERLKRHKYSRRERVNDNWCWEIAKPLEFLNPFKWRGNASLFRAPVPCRCLPTELR
jgi:hypothetical protein